jgi:transcriptional regulator with XRE-family HTH domain
MHEPDLNEHDLLAIRQREAVARALKRLRVAAGLSGPELAERLGWSQAKVSKVENARQRISVTDVNAWAAATGAVDDLREKLAGMAVNALLATAPGRTRHERPEEYRTTGSPETSAGAIFVYEPVAVPNLLQTPDYARSLLEANPPDDRLDVAGAVAARMAHQSVLYDQARRFEFLIPEATLRWRPGSPGTMLGQIDRIGLAATLPNLWIGLLPMDADVPAWRTHGFTILDERGDQEPLVRIETLTTTLVIDDPTAVERYRDAFTRLRGAAVAGGDGLDLLRRIATTLRD